MATEKENTTQNAIKPQQWYGDVMEGATPSFRETSIHNAEGYKRNHIGAGNTYDYNGVPNNSWERSANKVDDLRKQANDNAVASPNAAAVEANANAAPAPTPFSMTPKY